MPLSEHEQRILHEMEQTLYAHDPKFADKVRSETVYRYAGRNCKWSAVTFVLGLVVLVMWFTTAIVLGLIGFGIMLASLFVFTTNLRRLGRAGWHDVTNALGSKAPVENLNDGWHRLRGRFHRDG